MLDNSVKPPNYGNSLVRKCEPQGGHRCFLNVITTALRRKPKCLNIARNTLQSWLSFSCLSSSLGTLHLKFCVQVRPSQLKPLNACPADTCYFLHTSPALAHPFLQSVVRRSSPPSCLSNTPFLKSGLESLVHAPGAYPPFLSRARLAQIPQCYLCTPPIPTRPLFLRAGLTALYCSPLYLRACLHPWHTGSP